MKLFDPLQLRGITLKNRIVFAPVCQYAATDGIADDEHLVQLGRFALGGFGTVMVEATAVTADGRISHGDLGLWHDGQIAPLARIVQFLKKHGAVPAIQLSHAGRKASTRRPWRGEGTVTAADLAELGDAPWTTCSSSALPHSPLHATPVELDLAGIARISDAFLAATRRALAAGFEIIELHCAHGYLLNQFLSPIANKRSDAYGGSRENRQRLPLALVREMRAIWPAEKPFFVRVSATDHLSGGWALDDTIAFARELKSLGVDVVDCSSGGFTGAAHNAFTDYHVPYAAQVTRETGISTMAAGLITRPEQAEAIIAEGSVALVGLARQALAEPNWPHQANEALGRV